MMWVLVVCAGISWGGCGHGSYTPMAKAECFDALKAIRFSDGGIQSTADDRRRSAVAYCRPRNSSDPK